MGKVNVSLPDDLEDRFRRAAFERKGMKKGNLQEAFIEALEKWLKDA